MPKVADACGFTLIEVLLVMGLLAVLFGMSAVNLVRPQNQASLSAAVDTLVADIKSQQLLSVAGDAGTTTVAQPHGLYFQSGSYTLFASSAYSGGDTGNFVVTLDQGLALSTTLPGAQVLFAKASGEVSGFNASANTVTLSAPSGDVKILTINRFGAVTIN